MDKRLEGITEGAGREESRINQDFIDFLSKWSTPALLVMAALAVAYWGWNQYKAFQVAKVNKAMTAYTSAVSGGNPSPDTLANVAREYAGIRSVGELASLDLADVYLLAVQRGLEPGAEYEPGQTLPEEDMLTEDRRTTYLNKAQEAYQSVVDAIGSTPGKEELLIEAQFGLAAVAESRDDVETARTHLAAAKAAAEKAGFAVLATAANQRLDHLESTQPPILFEADSLPPLPEITPPEPTPEPTDAPRLENPPLVPNGSPPANEDDASTENSVGGADAADDGGL